MVKSILILVYDGIGMIGTVGGALGLTIGFSFTNLISLFINLVQFLFEKFNAKIESTANDIIVVSKSKDLEFQNVRNLELKLECLEKNILEKFEEQNLKIQKLLAPK